MAKRYFEREARHFFNPGWAHGKYFDNWSFVHILTGAILGTAALIFFAPPNIAFVVITISLAFYEFLEMISGIGEDVQNVISDIVLGSASAAIVLFGLAKAISHHNLFIFLGVCMTVNLLFVHQGWRSYLRREVKGPIHARTLRVLYFIYTLGIGLIIVSLAYWARGK